MKFLLLTFLLVIPMAAELLSDKQLKERIDAKAETPDDSLPVWKDALKFSQQADAAAAAEKKSRDEIARLDKPATLSVPPLPAEDAPLDEQIALSEKVATLIKSNQENITELTTGSKESPGKMADLAEAIIRDQTKLDELEIPAPDSDDLASARRQVALQEKNYLQATLKKAGATQDLLRREVELFDERMRRHEAFQLDLRDQQEKLTARIAELKKEEAEKTRLALEKSARDFEKIPALAAVIEEISDLNERRSGEDGLQASLAEARDYRSSITETRLRIKEQFKNAQSRIDLLEEARLGIDDETGLLLREQRASLPSTDEISDKLRLNLERAAKAQLAQLVLADRSSAVAQLTDRKIEALLEENPTLRRSQIQTHLKKYDELLGDLREDYRRLNALLTEGTEAAKLTIAEIDEYSNYIDKRLLWIKSTKPLGLREPLEEWQRIVALFSPETFAQVWSSIERNWFGEIIVCSLLFLTSLAIAIRRRSLRELHRSNNEKAARRNCTSILPTVISILSASLLSLWGPLLILLAAVLIDSPGSWHLGLLRLAALLFFLLVMMKFSRRDGLFVSHFKMHPDRAALIQRTLRWIFPFALPFIFLVTALTNSSDNSSASGRIVFLVALCVGCFLIHHLFHPKRSILKKEGKGSSLTRICYFVILAIPIIFAIGTSLGYLASVLLLRGQVVASLALLILAFLVVRFLTRWTLVSRRALAITQALRRREATLAERESGESDKPTELPPLDEVKAEAVDVVEVEAQSIQLFRLATFAAVFFGLWAIWSSTLPALSFLDEPTLWGGEQPVEESGKKEEKTVLIPNIVPTGSGDSSSSETAATEEKKSDSEKKPTPSDGRVSLQDLLLTLIFLALTFIAARNIPSLLSLSLFNRINLGPGGNFALTTTVRYLIILVGVVIALGQIGITWSKVQWLAAAITLGIGFGLQEIFANFVAGIILLFERPIRLGDVVTVGDISGRVTQIRIRATTIQQFNNRELLVPNKEFITSQLVNWTLKDSVLRFEIPVGIAYGSDTKQATEILNSLLNNHPDVMEDPKPHVLFNSFGNSTLDFKLRGFVSSVDVLLSVQSDLHYQIDDAFREAEIEIAFPQQDVHLRSLPEGMILASQDGADAAQRSPKATPFRERPQ